MVAHGWPRSLVLLHPHAPFPSSKYSLIVQVGLCTFHTPTDGEGAFIARPYNLWVVPAGRPLTLAHSSARFLRSHGLDFNAWIEEGVLTLSAAELDSAVQDLRTRHAQRSGRATPTGGADAAFVADAIAKAKEWAAARLAGETGGTDDVHDLPPCNAFLRRCLYESIEEAFPAHAYPALKTESVQIDPPDASAGGTATNRSRPAASGRAVKAIRLRWDPSVAAGDSMSETTDRLAQDLAALEARAGFLHIWRALCSAAVPVVLHNGLFDLMFLYNVLVGPLPEDVDEFKHAISQLLPEVTSLARPDPDPQSVLRPRTRASNSRVLAAISCARRRSPACALAKGTWHPYPDVVRPAPFLPTGLGYQTAR